MQEGSRCQRQRQQRQQRRAGWQLCRQQEDHTATAAGACIAALPTFKQWAQPVCPAHYLQRKRGTPLQGGVPACTACSIACQFGHPAVPSAGAGMPRFSCAGHTDLRPGYTRADASAALAPAQPLQLAAGIAPAHTSPGTTTTKVRPRWPATYGDAMCRKRTNKLQGVGSKRRPRVGGRRLGSLSRCTRGLLPARPGAALIDQQHHPTVTGNY